MFEQTPEAKSVFEKFRSNDTPNELFRHRDVLESHGLVVMNAIDEVISNLDDIETVYQLLLDQGRSHSKFSELTEEIFWVRIENTSLNIIYNLILYFNTI